MLCYLKRLLSLLRLGPQPTSPNSSPSSTKKSTTAPTNSAKPRIARLVEIAEQELGKKETKGRNLGPAVRKYQASTNLTPGPWPWCSAFCAWTLEQWLTDPENVRWLALKSTTPARWRPKTALAYGFLQWAKARPATTTILPDTATPEAGDIVVYDFSHIGIVKQYLPVSESFVAVEGNTNHAGNRDGDGVYLKVRPRSLARAFIRIHPSVA